MTRTTDLDHVRVLVTDGEQRSTLAVVRSLGLAGAHVIVASMDAHSLAGASRYCRKDILVPDPLAEPEAFVARLGELVRSERIDVLLPITEAALRPVLDRRRNFDSIHLPFPRLEVFARASDKNGLLDMAAGIGVPVPKQMVLASGVLSAADEQNLPRFPLVLKPSVSVAGLGARQERLAVRHADGLDALHRLLPTFPDHAFPLLVQERIVGPGIGLFLLRWEGRIIARFAHRRLREKPPSGGVSVYRESIEPAPDATAFAESLLRDLDWNGVAMVEFKRDEASQVPYLMEINGRFWGSLQLAIDAGVDFPLLLVQAALGRVRTTTIEATRHVRSRWLLGDLDHLLLRLRRTRAALDLGRDAPTRLRALGEFLIPWRPGDRFEVLRLTDPAPFFRELRLWYRELLR